MSSSIVRSRRRKRRSPSWRTIMSSPIIRSRPNRRCVPTSRTTMSSPVTRRRPSRRCPPSSRTITSSRRPKHSQHKQVTYPSTRSIPRLDQSGSVPEPQSFGLRARNPGAGQKGRGAKKKAEEERKQKEKEQYALDHEVDGKNCNRSAAFPSPCCGTIAVQELGPVHHRRLQAGGNFGPLFDQLPIAKVRDASTGIIAAIPD